MLRKCRNCLRPMKGKQTGFGGGGDDDDSVANNDGDTSSSLV